MPFFTGSHPGTVRLLPPGKGKVTSVVTMSSKEETTVLAQTLTTQVEESAPQEETCPVMMAKMKEIMRQRSNSAWGGIPKGAKLVLNTPRLIGQQMQISLKTNCHLLN